ncbi:hypothetical protein KXQ82_05745 [Mucilaginibacter sp. HMF5004]|uniref:hypothetical protein n=1 Tax=Mucilaginibacter rivuli TaxID=2857527 RepID=UPI001C5EEAA5|nr:hypothetical protein [Mucilaginibacter rivuli]MBW4889206.1 hypothetical protein [Mucilaginibacter rivuli]
MKIKLKNRPGKSPLELGVTDSSPSCPDIWEAENGDFVIIGKDITDTVDLDYTDAIISQGERVVIIPRITMLSAIEKLSTVAELEK